MSDVTVEELHALFRLRDAAAAWAKAQDEHGIGSHEPDRYECDACEQDFWDALAKATVGAEP